MRPLTVGLILWIAQLRPLLVASEREGNASPASPWQPSLPQHSAPGSFVEVGGREDAQEQANLSQNLLALAHRIHKGDPVELTYPLYHRYADLVGNYIDKVHDKVVNAVDSYAHEANMKSGKYGYGLDGLRSGIRKLQTNVQLYKNMMRRKFKTQTQEMSDTMQEGKLWNDQSFSKKLPEGLWHDPMVEVLTEEPPEDSDRKRRYHIGPGMGEVSTDEYLHPDTSEIYKMGYSHGFKDAKFGKPHGVEEDMAAGSHLEPEVFSWTRHGANWANANIFTGKNVHMHKPMANGWLTEDQFKVLFGHGGMEGRAVKQGVKDLEEAERKELLVKEGVDDILPYTWTMSGHLWARENGIFRGPPPSVRSWVTKKQMEAIADFNGEYKPESAEDAAKMHIFRKEEYAPNTSENMKRARDERRQLMRERQNEEGQHGMPAGWEHHLVGHRARGLPEGAEEKAEEHKVNEFRPQMPSMPHPGFKEGVPQPPHHLEAAEPVNSEAYEDKYQAERDAEMHDQDGAMPESEEDWNSHHTGRPPPPQHRRDYNSSSYDDY